MKKASAVKLVHNGVSALVAGLLTVSSSVFAEDIDVYNTTKTIPYPPYELPGDVAPPNPNYPNIMFILDASLSMREFDNGYTTSRLDRLRDAMETVLDSAENVNIGIMRLSNRNSGGRVIYPMSPIEYAREGAIEMVNTMELEYWTPTVGAILESAYYYGGHGVAYGKTRFSESNKNHVGVHLSRVSHPDSYTGGQVIREAGCTDANLNDPSCGSEKIDGVPVYRSPILSECQQHFQVVISDGAATGRVNRDWVNDIAGTRCVWSGKYGKNTCSVELAEFMATEDQSIDVAGINTVKTYTVGFNSSLASLEAMAEAGGGEYFESSSADDLATALNVVLDAASIPPATFSPPTISIDPGTLYSNRKDVYLGLFQPSLTPLWTGNLKGYWYDGELFDYSSPKKAAVDSATGSIVADAKSQWSASADGSLLAQGGAAAKIQTATERKVVTNHPNGKALLIDASNKITSTLVDATDLGLPDNFLQLEASDAPSLISWINGVDVLDANGNGSTVDDRRQYGDPLHSNPTLLTYGKLSDDTYDSVVYFGTNEGFLHAVDTKTGEDLYSFMPWELIGNIKRAYVNVPYGAKLYGVDGYLSTWIHDANQNGQIDASGDTAYLYTGMRRGGRSYYGLDVTQKAAPELLWTIKGGTGGTTGYSELGQSWSNMVYGRMKHPTTGVVTDVVVFSGGYDEQQDSVSTKTADTMGRAIYIANAATGALLWSASSDTSASLTLTDMKYSIPATPSVIDLTGDGVFDQIYVGDMGGQVWRFDFPESGTVTGGVIADLSVSGNPTRFFSAPDVAMIVTDDVDPYLTVSLGSGSRSQPLITESNAFYVLKQPVEGMSSGYGYHEVDTDKYVPLQHTELVDVTDNKVVEGTAEEIKQEKSDLASKHGWYIDLQGTGEKVLNASITVNSRVAFTSYVPGVQTACAADLGSNNLYILSLLDGTPSNDKNEDGTLDKADRSVELLTTGISAPPKTVFRQTDTGETAVDIVIGQESTFAGTLNLSRRTYWSELPEF